MEQTSQGFRLRVSENKMEVILDCDGPVDNFDSFIESIIHEFEVFGFEKPPSQEQLKEQLQEAIKKDPILKNVMLIKGKPPTMPRHGRTNWEGDFFNTGFVVDRKTGAVDYRQKAAKPSVSKGQLLGRRIPAEEGEDGRDVFGKPVPAEKPILYYPMAGKNVRYDVDEGAYFAEANGRVRLIKDMLSVDEVYVIEGDADLQTGNISHNGAVVIQKDVLDGAKIEATGDIEVYGVIESADILANGNLTVHGGITKSEGRKIKAAGTVHAKFILDAYVEAGKDIVVEREIISSTVKTLGALIIPRGRIVGGKTVALRGIYAGQTGTWAAVPTELIAGDDFELEAKLLSKRDKIKEVERDLSKMNAIAENLKLRNEPLSTWEEKKLTEMLAKISKIEETLRNLREDVDAARAKALKRAKPVIVVEKALNPKTILCLCKERTIMEEELFGPLRAELVEGEIKII